MCACVSLALPPQPQTSSPVKNSQELPRGRLRDQSDPYRHILQFGQSLTYTHPATQPFQFLQSPPASSHQKPVKKSRELLQGRLRAPKWKIPGFAHSPSVIRSCRPIVASSMRGRRQHHDHVGRGGVGAGVAGTGSAGAALASHYLSAKLEPVVTVVSSSLGSQAGACVVVSRRLAHGSRPLPSRQQAGACVVVSRRLSPTAISAAGWSLALNLS